MNFGSANYHPYPTCMKLVAAPLHSTCLKIYAQSSPCVLIGYSVHSKAYRLWDPASSRVFDSFHVSFTEHLDTSSSPFHPGTILGTMTASSPPSWEVSGPAPPEPPKPDQQPPSPSLCDTNPPSFMIISNPKTVNHTENNTEQQNNVPTQNNTIFTSRNTVTPSNNKTVNTSRNTVTIQVTRQPQGIP